jgi:hypothetical protein
MPTKLPSEKVIEDAGKILEEHAADIGHIALEWNALHDALGDLFVNTIDPHSGRTIVMAAWQSLGSDRSKRQMLERAAFKKLGAEDRLYQEIKWICGELSSLEDKRNDAVHTPFAVLVEGGAFKAVPALWTRSPRAQKVKGKDLKLELQSYRTNIQRLRLFAIRLIGFPALTTHGAAWPERPALPRPAKSRRARRKIPEVIGDHVSRQKNTESSI